MQTSSKNTVNSSSSLQRDARQLLDVVEATLESFVVDGTFAPRSAEALADTDASNCVAIVLCDEQIELGVAEKAVVLDRRR